ncbi:MAG: hypothetical protein KZY55_05850 [Paeniclostridium sp.]|nr:hypothetical protein [Paeniclostridium sp.]MBW4873569.1 hypothetical protein [Paeniclostridium sp.]
MFNIVKDMYLEQGITFIEGTIEQFFNDRNYNRYILENTINSVLSGESTSFKDFLGKGKYLSELDKQSLEFKHKREAKEIRKKREVILQKIAERGQLNERSIYS